MNVFQSTDTTDQTNWKPAFAMREEDEVENPPAGWKPDVTFVRRRVHLSEPMGMSDNLFVKVDVEQNVIDLDPEGGTPSTDSIIEVRADSAGKLEVGPIEIDAILDGDAQVVTIEFFPEGKKIDGSDRSSVKFQWNGINKAEPRYWEIFTGKLDYVPRYSYQVSVTVKGTLFSAGMSWIGPKVEGQGNGPIMIHVPLQDEAGVVSKRLTPREIAMVPPSASGSNGVSHSSVSAPPSTRLTVNPQGKLEHPSTKSAASQKSPPGMKTIAGYEMGELSSSQEEQVQTKSNGNAKKNKEQKQSSVLKALSGDQGWKVY
jgi:hypothetical protein